MRVDVECRTHGGVSHQFLHDFEFSPDTSQKSGVCVAERAPTDPFLDADPAGEIYEDLMA